MIRFAFAAISLLAGAENAQADNVVYLRCTSPEQITEQIHTLAVDLHQKIITHTSHTGQVTALTIMQNTSETLLGYGEVHGRLARLRLNSVSASGRIDNLMTDEDKPTLWNERTKSLGYPIDEEVWLGFSINCQSVEKLF